MKCPQHPMETAAENNFFLNSTFQFSGIRAAIAWLVLRTLAKRVPHKRSDWGQNRMATGTALRKNLSQADERKLSRKKISA
jgi:hypothetical protein